MKIENLQLEWKEKWKDDYLKWLCAFANAQGGKLFVGINDEGEVANLWNSGQLPDNWTVARLKTKHPSLPYNPAIANVFFRAGMIESWGRGTIKIIEECKKVNQPTPEFSVTTTDLSITFKIKIASQKNDTLTVQRTGSTADKVLHLIEQKPSITIAEMAAYLGVSAVTVKRILKNLLSNKYITRMGSNKVGEWIINIKY